MAIYYVELAIPVEANLNESGALLPQTLQDLLHQGLQEIEWDRARRLTLSDQPDQIPVKGCERQYTLTTNEKGIPIVHEEFTPPQTHLDRIMGREPKPQIHEYPLTDPKCVIPVGDQIDITTTQQIPVTQDIMFTAQVPTGRRMLIVGIVLLRQPAEG